nr:GIY-YIG nuclease family protein [Blastomonas sp. CCH13-E1]
MQPGDHTPNYTSLTDVTDDLEHRMSQHASGVCGGYTAKRRPVELVWSEDFPTREDAFGVEWQIKGWSRAKKEALIRGDWDLISRLSRGLRNSAGEGAGPSTGSG